MKQKNKITVVCKKADLWEAVKRKDPCIEIQGDLAKKMKWLKALSSVKKKRLTVELGRLNLSSDISTCSNAVMVAITGTEIAVIILSLGVTIALIIAVLRDYDVEVYVEGIRLIKK